MPDPKIKITIQVGNRIIQGTFDAVLFLSANKGGGEGDWNGGNVLYGRGDAVVPMLTAMFQQIPQTQVAAIKAICNLRRN